MDNFYISILVVVGISSYTIWYVIRHNHLKLLWGIAKKMCIEAYKYSINFLTPIFLFVYYSESLLNSNLYFHKIKVKALLQNPQNATELILAFIYIFILIAAIVTWVKKVLALATGNLLQINFKNNFVTIVTRIILFMLFLKFMIILLMPLFIYGLLGNYGL